MPNRRSQRNRYRNVPKRQRPPRRPRNGNKNVGTRTAAQTARNLMNPNQVSKRRITSSLYDSMYAKCRLDPFNSSGGMGIPDGIAARKIVIDHRSYTTLAIGGNSTTFDILILPTLPFQAIIRTPMPQNLSIDGNFGTDGNANNKWIPICFPPEYLTLARINPSNLAAANNPYESNSARIVTVGFKLTYIGKPIDASGALLASSCPISFGAPTGVEEGTVPVATYNVATANNYTNVSTRTVEPNVSNSAVAESVFNRVDVGLKGVLKTMQPVSTVKPWITDKVVLLDEATGTAFVNRYPNVGGQGIEGAMSFYDDRFQPILISASGLGIGTSMLLEVITCIEYFPEPTSTFSRLAKADTKSSPMTIKTVEQVLGSCPAVQTLREPSPFSKFVTVVSKTSKSLAPMLGPYAPIANAISAISDGIGELTM